MAVKLSATKRVCVGFLTGLLLGTASAELYRVPKKDSPRKTLEVSVSADIERRVAHYGVNVTAEECYGGDRQVELEDYYSGRRTPYSLTGPSAQCNAEGCKHLYWGKRGRFQNIDAYKPCQPELRQKLLSWLVDYSKQGATWAEDALLAKPCQLFRLIRGRSLWIFGDSLGQDFADAVVAYLVEYHVYKESLRTNVTNDQAVMDVLKRDPYTGGTSYQAWCQDLEQSTRICFSRFMKGPRFLEIADVLPSVLHLNDIVLFNMGLHYNEMDELTRDFEALAERFPTIRDQTGAKFVWRESTPQHFLSSTGSFTRETIPEAGELCRAIGLNITGSELVLTPQGTIEPQPGTEPEAGTAAEATLATVQIGGPRNNITQPIIDSLNIPTLRVWNMSLPLWEFHNKLRDCTHFCPPSWAHIHLGALQKVLAEVVDRETLPVS